MVGGMKKRFDRLIARDFKLLDASPIRTTPKCQHFGKCGACLWQGLKYEKGLKFKVELFERITGISAPIKGSPRIWGFRNVSNFIVTTGGIGLKEYGSPSKVVNLSECPLFSRRTPKYLRALKDFLSETGLRPWNLKRKAGDIHYLQVREGKFTGEVMVNLIAHTKPLEEVAGAFRDYFSFADSLYWSLKGDRRDDPRGEPRLVEGRRYIRERIDGVTYLLHPNSFFQTNSYALPILLKAVGNFTDGGKVLDLYSGVGTFGVYLAKRGFKVEGVEINPFAVEMANKNAELNGVNAKFHVGSDKDVKNLSKYDTIIVDPPRAGLHPKLIQKILRDEPEKIIYVSCNPKTLSENLSALREKYHVENAIGLDMFPHTPHVEAVVELRKV